MGHEFSRAAALLLVALGGFAALIGGGQVATCLGPLGVTAVQCAAATGITPTIGVGLPAMALSLALALALVAPVPRRAWWLAALGAVAGALAAVPVYLALRPRTLEGPGSDGRWYVIPLPLDAAGVTTAVISGAALGGLLAGCVLRRIGRNHTR